MINSNDNNEMVVLYAVVPLRFAQEIKIPKGSYCTVFETREFQKYTDMKQCRFLGWQIAGGIMKLARKLFPEDAPRTIEPGGI